MQSAITGGSIDSSSDRHFLRGSFHGGLLPYVAGSTFLEPMRLTYYVNPDDKEQQAAHTRFIERLRGGQYALGIADNVPPPSASTPGQRAHTTRVNAQWIDRPEINEAWEISRHLFFVERE